MNSLFLALEDRGYKVEIIDKNKQYNTRPEFFNAVTIKGTQIRFQIREKTDHIPNKDKDAYPRTNYQASGKLHFQLEDVWLQGARASWIDGAKVKLEQQITSIIRGMINVVRKEHEIKRDNLRRELAQEKAREEAARVQAEQERARAEQVKQQQQAKAEIDNLLSHVEDWHKARQIREYLQALQQEAIRRYGQIAPDGKLQQWIEWAYTYANHIDPLVE